MKKLILALIITILLVLLVIFGEEQITLTQKTITSSLDYTIDFNGVSNGVIGVSSNVKAEKKIKIVISKVEKTNTYNLYPSTKTTFYPLTFGDGSYSISIYENTTDTKYRKILTSFFSVKLATVNSVFLQSIQEINWSKENLAIKVAADIAKNSKTKEQMIKDIYNYISKTIVYDREKIKKIDTTYLPSIDSTLSTKNGICYDYSALLAAMLRSQGIPTKMIKGYAKNSTVYHAWNEIFLEKENRWIVVDVTSDAYLLQNGFKIEFERKSSLYSKIKEL